MRASRRNLAIIVGILAVLAIGGGIAVRLGLGETDELLPDFGDAGAGGVATAAAGTAAGARPLLGDAGVAAGMSRIAGTVRDLAHAPIGDVEVRFAGDVGEASATTDAAGRYRIDLGVGRYQMRAVADHAVSLDTLYIAVPAGLDVDGVDLEVVRTARVAGRVVDGNGNPVSGAGIGHDTQVLDESLDDQDTAPMGNATSSARGEFALTVPAGRVTVTGREGARFGSTTLHWVEPGADVNGVEVVLEPAGQPDAGVGVTPPLDGDAGTVQRSDLGAITGTVRGPDGPLAVFTVEVGWEPGLRFISPDGTYRIDGLIAGLHTVMVSAGGLAPASAKITVPARGAGDGSFTLTAGGAIEGTITSARTGRPVSGVLLSMASGAGDGFAYTDRAGRYALRDIAAGRRSLDARHPAFVGKIIAALTVSPGQVLRQDLVLEPATEGGGAEIELAGIGASLSMTEDRCLIVGLVPGGPAELADLRRDDSIISIDHRPVRGWTFAESIEAIRGVAGTVVRLEIIRGKDTFFRDVLRATIRYREPE